MTLLEKKEQIRNDFKTLPNWDERFAYLIDLGKELPFFHSDKKNEETRIRGCQSDAWLLVQEQNNVIHISGDADGQITKGIIALLVFLYNGISVEEMKKEDFEILADVGIIGQLSMNRASGLSFMIEKIRSFKGLHDRD